MPVSTQDERGIPDERPAGGAGPAAALPGGVIARPAPGIARPAVTTDARGWPAPWRQFPGGQRRPRPALARIAPWALAVVMTVQAVLSLRLTWSNAAFQDEALYLWAGRTEWAHWLHGATAPDLATWFSGAPVIYPPIGELASHVGGLAAARALSLVFMLAATGFLWRTAAALFDRRAAFFATALFAVLANTQFLGAFATYDAMAVMLIAISAWLSAAAVTRGRRARLGMLATAAAALALADATKYAATLFDPVVLAIVVLAAWRRRGGQAGLRAGLFMSGALFALLASGILLAGPSYWQGMTSTTLDRPAASATAGVILQRSYTWTSLLIALAALGIVLAWRGNRVDRALVCTLSLTGLLVPAEQIHVHTTVSLHKHVDYGAWFAAIAAGYAMARVSRLNKGVGWAPVLTLPIIAATVVSLGQAYDLFQVWPNPTPLMSALRPVLGQEHGKVLAEGDEYGAILYYLGKEVPFRRLQSTYEFSYTDPQSHRRIGMPASFTDAIRHAYFRVIILDHAGGHPDADDAITKAAEASPGCRESLDEEYIQPHVRRSFTVWICRPAPEGLRGLQHVIL
jgi:hypothetical protein